jgi:FkbM family methyltransferase
MQTASPEAWLEAHVPLSQPIAIVDVGALSIDGSPRYEPLVDLGLGRVTGFDPQIERFQSRLDTPRPNVRHLPFVIGDGRRHTLNVCRAPGMTSLLEPNLETLRHFQGYSEWAEIERRLSVETVRLDDLGDIDRIDYLAMDVQGAELLVIEGGRRKLSAAVAVHTEVSFLPLYRDSPLMADVGRVLQGLGYVLHTVIGVQCRSIVPLKVNDNPYIGLNQVVQADAVYVRDFRRYSGFEDEQLKRLALIAHFCYSSFDLAMSCLAEIESRDASHRGLSHGYLETLRSKLDALPNAEV